MLQLENPIAFLEKIKSSGLLSTHLPWVEYILNSLSSACYGLGALFIETVNRKQLSFIART